MKKLVLFIFILIIIFNCQDLVYGEEQQAQNLQELNQAVQDNEQNLSILDKASDWWVTLGKTEEEKAQILEERRLKRLEQPSQSTVEQVKNQANEKVSAAKEDIKNKAEQMKGQVHQNFTSAREKTVQKIDETKQQIKQKFDDTKTSACTGIETKKQQIKQESEKTFKGFLDGLFK